VTYVQRVEDDGSRGCESTVSSVEGGEVIFHKPARGDYQRPS
jgi:hypothetical protein